MYLHGACFLIRNAPPRLDFDLNSHFTFWELFGWFALEADRRAGLHAGWPGVFRRILGMVAKEHHGGHQCLNDVKLSLSSLDFEQEISKKMHRDGPRRQNATLIFVTCLSCARVFHIGFRHAVS